MLRHLRNNNWEVRTVNHSNHMKTTKAISQYNQLKRRRKLRKKLLYKMNIQIKKTSIHSKTFLKKVLTFALSRLTQKIPRFTVVCQDRLFNNHTWINSLCISVNLKIVQHQHALIIRSNLIKKVSLILTILFFN